MHRPAGLMPPSEPESPPGLDLPARPEPRVAPVTGASKAHPSLRDRVALVAKPSLRPAGIAVASRIGVLLVAGALSMVTKQSLGNEITSWDSQWYLAAAKGYPHYLLPGHGNAAQSALGFFPALPLLIRFTHFILTIDYTRSGLLATFATSITAAIAVWWLLRETEDAEAADRGTALVLFSPASFVLSMIYGEGLLITTCALAFLALKRRRWALAGLFAALAGATDPLGVLMIVPCAVAAWTAIRDHRDRTSWAAVALAPLGVLAFFAYLWVEVGTPLAWIITQRRGWQGGVPAASIPGVFSWLFLHGFNNINGTVKASSAIVVLLLFFLFIRVRPGAVMTSFVLAILAVGAASPVIGWTPRVALRAFPLLALLGARMPRRWFGPAVAVSAILMAVLAIVTWGPASPPFTP